MNRNDSAAEPRLTLSAEKMCINEEKLKYTATLQVGGVQAAAFGREGRRKKKQGLRLSTLFSFTITLLTFMKYVARFALKYCNEALCPSNPPPGALTSPQDCSAQGTRAGREKSRAQPSQLQVPRTNRRADLILLRLAAFIVLEPDKKISLYLFVF